MADADVDGSHIRTLLLTFFYRYFEELINSGYIYIAQPPLYSLKKGRKVQYVYTDKEKEEVLKKMGGQKQEAKILDEKDVGAHESDESQSEKETAGKISIQRYKGLGEMNPELLWETTMNPENRSMYQVTIEDAQEADKIFDVLMGREVQPRRRFIQARAKSVQNLDI